MLSLVLLSQGRTPPLTASGHRPSPARAPEEASRERMGTAGALKPDRNGTGMRHKDRHAASAASLGSRGRPRAWAALGLLAGVLLRSHLLPSFHLGSYGCRSRTRPGWSFGVAPVPLDGDPLRRFPPCLVETEGSTSKQCRLLPPFTSGQLPSSTGVTMPVTQAATTQGPNNTQGGRQRHCL